MIGTDEMRDMIKAKLETDITYLLIDNAPDDWKNYKLEHPNGAILVNFAGKQYTQPSGLQQTMRASFSLLILLRNGYNAENGLRTIDNVRRSITNDLLIENMPFWCANEEPLGEEDGIWYWSLEFILFGIMYHGE